MTVKAVEVGACRALLSGTNSGNTYSDSDLTEDELHVLQDLQVQYDAGRQVLGEEDAHELMDQVHRVRTV
jgi:hypothetical protein